MRIQVNYKPQQEDIFVWGLWGPKTINHILELLVRDIEGVNKSLKELA